MTRARRTFQVATVLGASMLIAVGCGGGDEVVTAPPADGATPTPGATTPGGTVGADPNAVGAVDPLTGEPITDLASTSSAPEATVPELVGEDVSGGLGSVGDTTPIFDAQAVETGELPKEKSDGDTATAGGGTTTGTDTEKKPAVTYSGAKIYVNGTTHSVDINGTFPKGDPVFRLLSVSADDIEIALVAGEFTASGGDGTFLDKGDLVSMVNASEQVTYRVKYLRPITGTSGISF